MSTPICQACKQHFVRHHTHVVCGWCWRKLDRHMQGDLIRTEKAWRAGKLGGAMFQSVRDAAIKMARNAKAVAA